VRKLFVRIVAFLGALVVGVVALGFLAFRYLAYEDRALPRAPVDAIIPQGASAAQVARLLHERGIVSSRAAFEVLARLQGEAAQIKAGQYHFEAHRSLADVLHQVVVGGQQVAVWVTIPEGFTAREVAQTLAEHSLGEEDAFETYFLKTPFDLGCGVRSVNLEGYLFPDTYLIPTTASVPEIAKIMTDEFAARLPRDASSRAKKLGRTLPEIVTLASMVEREAKADDERPLMAGVYYNRLRIGMPLEVDATIEYTFAHHKDVITESDLARDSPYNTYKHAGLPPTPIANPGAPSLLAALDPKASNFLYYVYMGNGHHAFSRTLAEHEANVAKYLH
jgi:UPF0755 protein